MRGLLAPALLLLPGIAAAQSRVPPPPLADTQLADPAREREANAVGAFFGQSHGKIVGSLGQAVQNPHDLLAAVA